MDKKWLKKLGEQVFGGGAMGVGAVAAAKMADAVKGKPDPDIGESVPVKERSLLQRIDFNYQDSPEHHGWQIEGNPSFSILPGGVLDITSSKLYSMHYRVEPLACSGRLVEFVAKYEARNTAVYPRVVIQNQNGSEQEEVWLQVKIGSHPPEQARGSHEWIWYVQPTRLDGGWSKFRVDLPQAVEETFGNLGWSYRELIGFRLRGRLKIRRLSVYS